MTLSHLNLMHKPSVRLRRYARYHPVLNPILNFPTGYWISIPDNGSLKSIHKRLHHIINQHNTYNPIVVIYSIPDRDICGYYSTGGCNDAEEYLQFIYIVANELSKGKDPIIILEPDALPAVWKEGHSLRRERTQLISKTIDILNTIPNPYIYIDVGNPGWIIDTYEAGKLLIEAGVDKTSGFSVNVSNFYSTDLCIEYSEQIAIMVEKNYIIDTSRNGNGNLNSAQWCNPPGRALGISPTLAHDNDQVDACLWIKPPGESDGECNGGPKAGVIWPEYVEGLLNGI
jgi:endoglucanase